MGELFGVHYALDKLFEHARSGAAEPLLVPPGLLLSLGDGRAVEVTGKMRDAAVRAAIRSDVEPGDDPDAFVKLVFKALIQQGQEPRLLTKAEAAALAEKEPQR